MSSSDGLVELLGFGVGDVVPTPDLLAAHVHPQDRDAWDAAWTRAATGATVTLWHRIVTTGEREITVLTTLVGLTVDGVPHYIELVLVDLTDRLREEKTTQFSEEVERASRSRGLIEAAKGMLMVSLDIDDIQAFDLIRWHSSHSNLKVRDVAALLVDGLSLPRSGQGDQRRQVAEVLSGLTSAPDAVAPVRVASSATSLPEALLPRILTRAVDDASLGICVVDWERDDQPLVYVNHAFERLTGYAASDVIGHNCRFLQGPETEPERLDLIRAGIAAGREVRVVLRNYRKDGTAFFNELYLSPVRNKKDRITHYLGYQQDVTERVERQDDLGRMGLADELTGLPNALAAERHLDHLIQGGSAQVVALTSSHFRGRGTGTDLARTLALLAARRVRTAVGRVPLVAVAGESLLVISDEPLPDAATLAGLFAERPIVTLDGPFAVPVRVGRAAYPQARTGRTLVDLALAADPRS